MARNMIDWDNIKDKAFSMIAAGEHYRDVAEACGVAFSTFNTWFAKKQTKLNYEKYLRENDCRDERMEKNRVTIENTPILQNEVEKFRDSLKIGGKVKNIRYRESGTVVEMYENVFTVRTEQGFLSSYGYNCFMDFA